MGKHIIVEAERCVQCKNPRCTAGCPIDTDVKGMISDLLGGNIEKAGKKLFENNPLSIVCALVCPHERQCEGSCILGIKSTPVQISNIEYYVSDFYLDKYQIVDTQKKEGNIAIVGSGPAGITLAFDLSMKGYNVTIFEGNDKIGGVMRYGIPEYRLSNKILDRIEEKLRCYGVKIRPNTFIGKLLTVEDLFRDDFDAIFIGTGVWKSNKLNIKGESLANVHFAINYLKNPDVYNLGENVVVIGAGNTAMDVARTIVRESQSKNTTVMYRKGLEDMSATKYEIDYARIDGVNFNFYKRPLEFTEKGIKFISTKEIIHEDGNRRYEDIEGSEDFLPCDSIIVAVGQGPRDDIVNSTKDIDITNRGLVITNESGQTSKDGVFASGDVVTGAKTVVEAVNYSKKIAVEIEEYIRKKRAGK